MNDDLKSMVGQDEKIMWEGKPSKKCFIFESIFKASLVTNASEAFFYLKGRSGYVRQVK